MWTENPNQRVPTPAQTGLLLNRRQMLQRMCAGFGLVGLGGLLGPHALFADAATRAPHFTPRAKRVIFLFLNGGPSQVDTFDPKPALKKYAGQRPEGALLSTDRAKGGGLLPSPYKFAKYGRSGIEVSELFPHVARCVDDLCILR